MNRLARIIVGICLIFTWIGAYGITPEYTPQIPDFLTHTPMIEEWSEVSVSGKLRTDFLPLRPTVKFYMKRNVMINATLSVPILGEMARIEANESSVRLYNKNKKVYYEKNLTDVARALGENVTLGNLQDLILGRPFTPGAPKFNCSSEELEYDISRGSWWLKYSYPKFNVQSALMLDTSGRILYALCARFKEAMTNHDAMPSDTAVLTYSYNGTKTACNVVLISKDKEIDATYEYGKPDWNPQPIKQINIDNSWRQVESLKEFIKTF